MTSRSPLLGSLVLGTLTAAFGCVGHTERRAGGAVPPATAAAATTTGRAAARACGPTALPPARVWRLTHAQLRNTLLDVFGHVGPAMDVLPADARLDGFANGASRLGVPPVLLEYYRKVADEVATEVIRHGSAPVEPALVRDQIEKLGQRAWRRPLPASEIARLERLHAAAGAGGGPELAWKSVIEAMILSPSFLFRFELGDNPTTGAVTRLTDWEIASALSYTLWDGPPDATLMALAAAGRLRDPATLEGEARRLLTWQRRASPALTHFFRQWMKIEDLSTLGKDSIQYPLYTPELARDLMQENRLFLESVLFEAGGDRSLRTLLGARYGFLNGKTGRLYAVATARGGELKRTPLPAGQRRGLFTQAAFLAARADADATRPVDRGSFVREEVLCAEVPPPPDEFKFDESKITEDMTAREKLVAHARSPFCARCHALFDGIGFAMESYDAIGQFRTTDRGKVLDTSGTLPLPGEPDLHFANFVELMDQLTTRRRPYDCFAGRYLAYASGRRLDDVPPCERTAIAEAFAASGYRIDSLVLDVVRAPSFISRINLPPGVEQNAE